MLYSILKVIMLILLLSAYEIRVANGKPQRRHTPELSDVYWSRKTPINPRESFRVRNNMRVNLKTTNYRGCDKPSYFHSNYDILLEECDLQSSHPACLRNAKVPLGWHLSRVCQYEALNLKIKSECQRDGSWDPSIANCPTGFERDSIIKKVFSGLKEEKIADPDQADDLFKGFPCIPLTISKGQNTNLSCLLPGDDYETLDCLRMAQIPSGTYFFMRCKAPFYSNTNLATIWHCLDGHWKGDSTNLMCYYNRSHTPNTYPPYPQIPINSPAINPEADDTERSQEFPTEKYSNIRNFHDNSRYNENPRRRPEENEEIFSNGKIPSEDIESPRIDIRYTLKKPSKTDSKNVPQTNRPAPPRRKPESPASPQSQYSEENYRENPHSKAQEATPEKFHSNVPEENSPSNVSYDHFDSPVESNSRSNLRGNYDSNTNDEFLPTNGEIELEEENPPNLEEQPNKNYRRKCPALINDYPGLKLECVYHDKGWNSVVLTECQEPSASGTEARYTCRQFYQSVSKSGLSTVYRTCEDGNWVGETEFACRLQCGTTMSSKTPYIVNGIPAKRGQWPWHSAIFFKERGREKFEFSCGGTLISINPPMILTAAHCITIHETSTLKDVKRFRIDLGKFMREESDKYVQSVGVKEFFVHESFNPLNYDSDIGLVLLDKPLKVSQYVRPICFQQSSDSALEEIQLSEGSIGTVVGWGFDQSRTLMDDLRMTNLQVIGPRECLEANKDSASGLQSRSTTYCAGSHNNSNVCNGDSGGGMYFKSSNLDSTTWFLQGIVSVGISENGECKPDTYSIFTRVGRYAEWLVRILSKINYEYKYSH